MIESESYLGPLMADYEPCCEEMRMALEWKLLQVVHGEVVVLGKLPKGAKAGNVLTGEPYNPATFTMGQSLRYCPWCREPQPLFEEEET